MGEEARLLRSLLKRLTNVTNEAATLFASRIEEVERIGAAEKLAKTTEPHTNEVNKTLDEWYQTRTGDEISWLYEQNISETIIKALEDMLDSMPVNDSKDDVKKLSSTKDIVTSERPLTSQPQAESEPPDNDEPNKVSWWAGIH